MVFVVVIIALAFIAVFGLILLRRAGGGRFPWLQFYMRGREAGFVFHEINLLRRVAVERLIGLRGGGVVHYLRDFSLVEIGAVLDCPVGTVKSRLFHALDKLRKMNAFSTQRSDFTKKGGML